MNELTRLVGVPERFFHLNPSGNPARLLNANASGVVSVTNSAGIVTLTGAPVITSTFVGGRSAVDVLYDTTNSSKISFQSMDSFMLAEQGDYFALRGSIRFATGFSAHTGLFFGACETDTTIHSDTVASISNNAVGIYKTTTGTSFQLVTRDDNGTPVTATLAGVTIADGVWYDFAVVARAGAAANSGLVELVIGVGGTPGKRFRSSEVFRVAIETSSAFPDTNQLLRPSFEVIGDTTDAVNYQLGLLDAAAYKAR